jgi:uncharacterized protein (DUF3820 family)
MLLPFGVHRGKKLENIPEDYLMWLGKPKYSGKFYENARSTELVWKVPFNIKMEARKILESRGYKLIGERWEK